MSTPQALIDLLGLEATNSPAQPTFPELLEKLYQAKYTGAVTMHFAWGQPRSVVLSTEPVKVPLDSGGALRS